jgi:hypothetical protein
MGESLQDKFYEKASESHGRSLGQKLICGSCAASAIGPSDL